MKRYRLFWSLAFVLLLSVVTVSADTSGTLDSPAPPNSASSFTLEDIYQRLDAGTAGSQSVFTEPSVGTGTATMHTLNEIMAEAPLADNINGAKLSEVLAGKTFWSLRTDIYGWGPKTGTVAVGSDLDGSDGAINPSIPVGFYWGKTATCNDSDLIPGNIKSGVDILGVTGDYPGHTGDATTAHVWYPKTFCNATAKGLTGQRYGGCACSGTLHGTRWCDNSNGTVTDMNTCLVWLQKADWGGSKQWRKEGDYREIDDARFRAGLLKAGATGANLGDGSVEGDWRLPTKTELVGITAGVEGVSSANMRAFTGIQGSSYWSSSSSSLRNTAAWTVNMADLSVIELFKNTAAPVYVWPVRSGS
jgi:hypothetical protein